MTLKTSLVQLPRQVSVPASPDSESMALPPQMSNTEITLFDSSAIALDAAHGTDDRNREAALQRRRFF